MDKLKAALIGALNAACLAFFGFGYGPGLVHDGRLMFAQKVEVRGFPEARCRVYGGLFHVCSASPGTSTEEVRDGVTYSTRTGREQSAFFVGIGASGPRDPGKVLAAADDPSETTTGFSLRVFWDRLITFLIAEFIFLFMFLFALVQLFAPRETARNRP